LASLVLLKVSLRLVDELIETSPALVWKRELRAIRCEMRCQRVDGRVQRVVALPSNYSILTAIKSHPVVHLLLHTLVPSLHFRCTLVNATRDLHVLDDLVGVLAIVLVHVEFLLVLLLVFRVNAEQLIWINTDLGW